jgi:L-asparagine oxygenase
MSPEVVQVTEDEREHIARATELLLQGYGSIDAPAFRRMLPALAGQYLPERLYTLLADFRDAFQAIDYGALILKGLVEVNQGKLGPTPARWQEAKREEVEPFEFITALIHGVVGGALAQFYYQRKGDGFSHCVIQSSCTQKVQPSSYC